MMSSSELRVSPRTVLPPTDRFAIVSSRSPPGAEPFVFGVRSTGIYCRTDCPARRPSPSNIIFFDSPREAVVAGFRACRRCHPERGLDYSPTLAAVERACRRMEAAAGDRIGLAELARQVGFSPAHFHRMFVSLLGISPKQYLEAVRSGRFRAELRGGRSVRAATYAAGHRSLSWPYSARSTGLGMDAGEFRRGAGRSVLFYRTLPSPLGTLLVAATTRGISSVSFGEDEAALLTRLRKEFPFAELRPDPSAVRLEWCRRIVDSLGEGRLPISDLPLDLRATTFQARVWNAIRKIGRGSTRSYSEIACELGEPRASRAVAGACAANPTALLIPCHRVVRADGDLGGYRWGVDRKRRLLASESTEPSGR